MTEEVTTPQAEPVQLSYNDLAAALQIIDVCVQRGAIRGEEMTSVGTVRDRISAFVEQAKTSEEGEAAEETSEAA